MENCNMARRKTALTLASRGSDVNTSIIHKPRVGARSGKYA